MTLTKRPGALAATMVLILAAADARANFWWQVTTAHAIFPGEQVDMHCFVGPTQPVYQVAQLFRFVGLSCTWYPMHYPYSEVRHFTQDIDEANPGSLILGDVLLDYWCCPAVEETYGEGVFEGRATGQVSYESNSAIDFIECW